jgi:uncharacterized protein DUF4279
MPDEDTEKPPKVFVWLSVVSEKHSADEISAVTGLRPDRVWRIGDQRPQTSITEKTHGWVLTSRLQNIGFDVEAHIDDLLQKVKPAAEALSLLREDDVVTVHVAIYSESRVLISVEPHVPRRIAALGAGFDLEIYFTPREGE